MITQFSHYFFGIMDKQDKKGFGIYTIVLFLGSIFSILGIGAVIPFIHILIQPEKIMALSLFQGWSYHQVIILFTTMLIAAFLLKNVVAFALLNYQSHFLYGLVAKIQSKLFRGYMALPYEYHLYRSTPDLIKNVNNETNVFSSIVGSFGTFSIELFSLFFILVLLIIINPIFTISVVFSLLIAISFFMKLIKVKIEYYAKVRTNAWSLMTDNVLAGLSGIKEAKLYHCENIFLKNFQRNTTALKSSSAFQMTFQQAPRMLIEFIGLAVVMVVLCAFILLGNTPEEMFVLLGVFGVAAAQLLPSLNRLTQAMVQIKYGMPALETIYNELTQVSKADLEALAIKSQALTIEFNQTITLNNLHYIYKDGTVALTGVNIDLPKNKRIAFVGASGAGKTTLVDLLMGLYLPKNGEIMIDGKVLKTEADIFSFQRLFAYIPQSIVLYDQSIQENIAFGVPKEKIDREKIAQCLQAAQLEGFVQGLSQQENTLIGESGVRLSGGQRQRIGIARALYQNPEILVMDEATSALDNQTEKEVTNVLSTLKHLTIITIAHRLTTIQHYDIIYMLDQGKVIASGDYNELLAHCDKFKEMVSVVNQ